MKHHQFSPSQLAKFAACPCYKAEAFTTSAAAEDGTRLHKAVQSRNFDLCNSSYETDMVTECLQYAKDREDESITQGHEVFVEYDIDVEDITQGTADYVIVPKDTTKPIHVIDWKFGKKPVLAPEHNPQLLAYGLGVFENNPQHMTCALHIVQPKIHLAAKGLLPRTRIGEIRTTLVAVIAAIDDPNKQPTPEGDACISCANRGECPALHAVAQKVQKELASELPIEYNPSRILAPGDRAKAQVLSYIMEEWATAIRKANTKAVVEDGIEIPGFAIRSREGKEEITDPVAAWQKLNADEIPLEAFLQACTVSMPKLAEQFRAIKGGTKTEARTTLNYRLRDLILLNEKVTFLQRITKGKTNADDLRSLGGATSGS